MSRLVVVSNRLPSVRVSDRGREPEIPAGGLASAVFAALRRSPGSLWLGWSGRSVAGREQLALQKSDIAGVRLLGLGLTRHEIRNYYRGFCNETLWPLLHCFQTRVHLETLGSVYQSVQSRFAVALRRLLREDDLVWVHDYHLFLLGQELRKSRWTGRIGFFLHTPFPPFEHWQLLPDPRDFLTAMLDYDLIGFHTQGFLDNYVYCCKRLLDAHFDGHTLRWGHRSQQLGVYPIGIDPQEFLPPLDTKQKKLSSSALARVEGRQLILGVDRLDYTKGIPERVLAFEEFLRLQPDRKKKVSFVQIASPSRTDVAEYAEQKSRVERLVGRVNAELSEHDWLPIRYLYRSYSRDTLARYYREADVGLVTPLRDGMNLVAKEFVAAQHRASPGVLVLSRFAGAAEDLPEALIVNPYHRSDMVAGIERALSMQLEERQERHAALLERVVRHTASEWARCFVQDLETRNLPEPELDSPVLVTPVSTAGRDRQTDPAL